MKQNLFILFTVLFFAACGSSDRPIQQVSPEVRVLISEAPTLELRPEKNFIFTIGSRREMGEGIVFLSVSNDMLEINGTPTLADTIEIYPNAYCGFKGEKYRGNMRIVMKGNLLQLINVVDMETYLYGVLPKEVSPDWEMQALKAQAIVSRTYALYELANSRKSTRPYDLYDDTRSQVYNGMNAETRITSMAVDSTMGEVIRYQGKIIQAFFHAASGGMTESSLEAFGDDKPYLQPVNSPFSSVFKDNKWEFSVTLNDFEKNLKTSPVKDVIVKERTASKRIKSVEIVDSANKSIVLSGKDFRNIIGPVSMKSTRANIKITNNSLLISGMGYGHGVGMGQWDARGMAKQGFQYKEIAAFFYPGTTLDKIW